MAGFPHRRHFRHKAPPNTPTARLLALLSWVYFPGKVASLPWAPQPCVNLPHEFLRPGTSRSCKRSHCEPRKHQFLSRTAVSSLPSLTFSAGRVSLGSLPCPWRPWLARQPPVHLMGFQDTESSNMRTKISPLNLRENLNMFYFSVGYKNILKWPDRIPMKKNQNRRGT